MRTARREFPAELEREAVALREGGGRPRMRIAAELGLQPSWLEERAGGPRELERARMERMERARMDGDVSRDKPSASSRRGRGEGRPHRASPASTGEVAPHAARGLTVPAWRLPRSADAAAEPSRRRRPPARG